MIERTADVAVDALRGRGYTVAASVVEGGEHPERLAGVERCALLVGDEGSGLPADIVAKADLLITIPMPGHTESLNAGVAGSLLAYELARRPTKTT